MEKRKRIGHLLPKRILKMEITGFLKNLKCLFLQGGTLFQKHLFPPKQFLYF